MNMERILETVSAMEFEAERMEYKSNAMNNPTQAEKWKAVADAYSIIARLLTDEEYADHMAQYYVDDEPWHVDWD